MGTIHHLLGPEHSLDGLKGKRSTIKKKKKKESREEKRLTMARSLFKPRKTLCCLMDLRSIMSLGSNRDWSTALVTYPTVPCEKSRIEVSLGRAVPSNSMCGAQARAAAQWSPLFFPSLADLVCIPLGCLAPPLRFNFLGRVGSPCFYHFLTISSLFLLWSTKLAWRGWVGGGVGSLVWAAFPSVCPPG